MESDKPCQLIMLGGMGVGKTTMIQQLINRTFVKTEPTIHVDSSIKKISVDGSRDVDLSIMDTVGQER